MAALSNYRKELIDMQDNIHEIANDSKTLRGQIHEQSVTIIMKKMDRELSCINDSIYLLEEELKSLLSSK